ncbi:MAG: DUF1579 family protein [Planctomycetota bacterium]
MEMPQPDARHQQLHRLAGTWQGVETMHPSPWDPGGSQADGRSVVKIALGGFYAIVDYTQSKDGHVVFEGHGVYSIDGGTGEVMLHWYDNIGQGVEEFRGAFAGDVLTLQSKNQVGFARLTYDYSQPGKLLSAMDMSPDGENWNRLFDGVYELRS